MQYPNVMPRRALKTPLAVLTVLALVISALALAACASPAAPTGAPATSAPAAGALERQNAGAPAPAATSAAQPTSAPAAQKAPPSTGGGSDQPSAAIPLDHKIIKNAQLVLTVDKTSTAVERLTAIASDAGGYLQGSHTFAEGSTTGAQVTMQVPVDRFEEALNRVRNVALKITSDTTSSSDVSAQYVDLQSRQTNLEATRDRIRQFLDKAATVDEALKVNQQLSDVEAQIEQIKGQLNVLNARSSFSTITVDLHEPQPTPTPTLTPTPTPTPTPIGWNPGQTFNDAARVQTSLLRAIGDLLIWVIVVLLPYVVVFGLVAFGATWLIRRFVKPAAPRAP
ncbi:MAG: DUF4349 domain-containing protein [Anaerolineae bacterium]